MEKHIILIMLAIVTLILVTLIIFELGYIIYIMNNESSNSHNKRHSKLSEHFNPERNYPQPPNSIIKESPVPLYYAAGNTETTNNYEQLRDDYYVRDVKHTI